MIYILLLLNIFYSPTLFCDKDSTYVDSTKSYHRYRINNDSIRYYKAFEYIKNSKAIEEKFYWLRNEKSKDSLDIYVSYEIIEIELFNFRDEIINYEFPDCSIELKERIKDLFIDDPTFVTKIDKSLSYLNKSKNIDIVIFFSEIEFNRLTVRIKLYIKDYGKKFNRHYYATAHANELLFLLYFNENNEIIKSFMQYWTD